MDILQSQILEDTDRTSVLYPTINRVEQHLTLFDTDFDTNKRCVTRDLMIRMRCYVGGRVKDADPTRTNPEGVVGYELYRINYASYGKGVHTLIRDVRDNHEKIFVGDTYMFDSDVLQLLNINYELSG